MSEKIFLGHEKPGPMEEVSGEEKNKLDLRIDLRRKHLEYYKSHPWIKKMIEITNLSLDDWINERVAEDEEKNERLTKEREELMKKNYNKK